MTSTASSAGSPPANRFAEAPRPGESVLTPSGKVAIVISVVADEVTVEWPDGERAAFRVSQLRRAS